MENFNFAHGCEPSKKDKRTIKHSDLVTATETLVTGGTEYLADDIEHQHTVGVCCAASIIQVVQKMYSQ